MEFTGKLNPNEIFGAIYNMIISQQVFADNIAGTNSQFYEEAMVDGGLYGDSKLYYSTDVLKSEEWGNDGESENLLKLYRPSAPKCQVITLDKFRQISLTTDEYMSKRAWGDENAFSSFNSVMKGWIHDTKRVYDSTLYNAFIGTNETNIGKQTLTFTPDTSEGSVSEAQQIAQYVADLITELTDVSRDYNDYGFLRSYNEGDIKIIWNSKFLNKIKKIDLPTIFHNEFMDKFTEKLPARYFGTVNTSSGTTPADNTKVRALVEKDFGSKHCFPGDLLPNSTAYEKNETYTEDAKIICKIFVKLAPYMSAFQVGTSFFNPKSLTENQYLTWGYNTLAHLSNYPWITIKHS